MDTGFSSGGVPYEYTVAEAKGKSLTLRRVGLICLYIFFGVGILLLATGVRLIVPLLALAPLLIWILVFLTWKYTQVEYEYSFFAGKLTVCRLLGGRSRRVLADVNIKELSAIFPYENEYIDRAERFGADKTLFAASSTEAERLYIALWKDELGKRQMLLFEPDEKALKILRYYNISALTVKK